MASCRLNRQWISMTFEEHSLNSLYHCQSVIKAFCLATCFAWATVANSASAHDNRCHVFSPCVITWVCLRWHRPPHVSRTWWYDLVGWDVLPCAIKIFLHSMAYGVFSPLVILCSSCLTGREPSFTNRFTKFRVNSERHDARMISTLANINRHTFDSAIFFKIYMIYLSTGFLLDKMPVMRCSMKYQDFCDRSRKCSLKRSVLILPNLE